MSELSTIGDTFLNLEEAASYLALPTKKLRAMLSARTGPPVIKIGSNLRFSQASLYAWMMAQEKAVLPKQKGRGFAKRRVVDYPDEL